MIGKKIGPYEIIEEIGAGGMASVFRARQESMGRFVAVKIIHKAISMDRTAVERFQREAQVIARLEHPHILPVYDYNGAHDPPYIVMRYLPSGTLKDIMERTRLPLPEIAFIYRQLSSAFDYAHRMGVIHRDIKPSNIMVDTDGNVFVTDFGIARLAESGGNNLTGTGMAIGTPGYMAPEQSLGSQIDGRADVYSLGAMLFEMVTGSAPYNAETPMGVLLKHINDPVPSALALNPDLPAGIDDLIKKALAKNPDDRYATCSELANDLITLLDAPAKTPSNLLAAAQQTVTDLKLFSREIPTPAARGKPGSTRATVALDTEGATQRVDTDSVRIAARQPEPEPASRRGMWIAAALLLLGAVAAGVLFMAMGSSDEPQDEPTAEVVVNTEGTDRAATRDASITETSVALPTQLEETREGAVGSTETSIASTQSMISVTGTAIAELVTPTDTDVPTQTLTPTRTDTPTETPSEASARVTVSRATIYAEPLTTAEELTVAPEGSILLVTGATPNRRWYFVEFLGVEGWILSDQISVGGNLTVIAEIISPTPTASFTPSATATPTSTDTPTSTATPSATETATSTATATVTPSETLTPTQLATATDTAIPTSTPVPPGTMPYVIDMEAADTLTDWEFDPAQWQLRTDGGNTALYGQTGFTSSMTVLGRVVPQWVNPGEDDMLLSFKINLLEFNSGGRFIFKFEPNTGYYVLEMLSGVIVLKRGQPGFAPDRPSERELGRMSSAPITTGRWYEFTVWAESTRTFVYLNKELIIKVNDPSLPLAPGGILLQTFASNSNPVGWDDIIVQRPEAASEHFEGSTFPTTWERDSQRNVTNGVESNGNQYIQLENEAEVSPVTPALGNFILYSRLNNVTNGYEMFLRESNQGSLWFDAAAGNIVLNQLNSSGEVIWTQTLRNFYGYAAFEEIVLTIIGERLTIFKDGEIILEEDLVGLPPSGFIRFKTADGETLRIDDFLVAETELSSTADATFAFDILSALSTRPPRDLRWDWEEDFSDPFRTRAWWEGGMEGDPGEYFLDESVDFDAAHRRYYVVQSGEFPIYRRIRREIDGTLTVFGNGEDRANFRDSVDIYVEVYMRLPAENPVGAEAWVGVRSIVNASGGLYQYKVSLVRGENGTTLVRVAPDTQTDRTPIYEEAIDVAEDGWVNVIVVTYDDRMAFFVDGRVIASIRDVALLSGTLAIGLEPNTLANFDDLVIRDTSVNE